MYKCSVCEKGVLVKDLPEPIRACNCTQEKVVDGEKVIVPASITMDIEATAYGRSQFKS
jgi:hypothetical protein